jgi:catechol 2,3-dioxygenase-like lactoylglutathione lyase family enzyme
MAKHRTGEPWVPSAEYGQWLPTFSVNLLVRDMAKSVAFYRDVLLAIVEYSDVDFAALKLHGQRMMLHADHTYENHPWSAALAKSGSRGIGAEMRLFGLDPDEVEKRARAHGAPVLLVPTDKPHGWREVWVGDPDGYLWTVGVPLAKKA